MFEIWGARFRAQLAGSTAILALCAGAAQAQTVALNIPPQPLSASLVEVGKQTGESIIFSPQSLNGIQAPAVQGKMSARQAVEWLISGTELEIAPVAGDGLVVRSASEKQTDLSGSLNLIKVDAPILFAQAQSAPSQPIQQSSSADAAIEQVVVSASRITIAGYTQPTPVTVVGSAQLEKDAYANINDAVRALPQLTSPPTSFSLENGGSTGGTEGINLLNLRNLGYTRTLVLYDGQRVVSSALSGGVDTSTLPSAVIARVDVVTGGASAAWGSDAVAGVVNYVLNKNFDGFKANIQFGDTTNAQYRDLTMSAAWGGDVMGGRGHLVLAADADMRPDVVLQGSENWFSDSFLVSNPAFVAGNAQPQLIIANNVALATSTIGGLITSSPAGTGPNAAAANALRGIEFVGAGIPQLVNFGNLTQNILSNGGSLTQNDTQVPLSFIGVPLTKYTLFVYGRYKLTSTIQASLQLNYGYTTGKDFGQANYQTPLTIASDNAFIPASVRTAMQAGGITSFGLGILEQNGTASNVPNDQFFQTAEASLGPEISTNQHQMMRGVFTLEGTLGDDWSWNAYYQHSTVRYWTWAFSNDLNANRTLAEDAVTVTTANRGTSNLALGSIACRSTLTSPTNGCIPLDVFGINTASAAALAYIAPAHQDHEDQQLNQDEASASMEGTLPWELPAGKVAVSFGAEYRKEAAVGVADPRGFTAGWSTGNFANFPSADYYVYEGFAEVDAPILKNNIVNSLDFSAAGRITDYSTSGVVETWKLGLTSQVDEDFKLRGTLSEDIRAPLLNDLFIQALQNGASFVDPKTGLLVSGRSNTIGNPNLVPEEAHTISAGVVLTPHWIDGLQASVDYYHINLTKALGSVSSNSILQACTININDPLCTHLSFNGPGGALSTITTFTQNIASITNSGFDILANYSMDFWDGTLSFQSTNTYQDEITQSQPGTQTDDYAGVIDANSRALFATGAPKWKGILSGTYSEGPYSFTVQTRWFGTGITNNQWNTGNLVNQPGGIPNMMPQYAFHIPMVGYLDLRGNYKWNDNISFYGAVDNAMDTPPPLALMYVTSTLHPQGTAANTYDMLGRQLRIGIRFSY